MVLSNAKTEIDLAFTRKDLKGLSYENAFGGSTSFLRRRYTKDLKDVDVAITGAVSYTHLTLPTILRV